MKTQKRKRFERWASSRVNKCIHAIHCVRSMGNRAIWEYTDEEAARIVARIKEEVATLDKVFAAQGINKFKF